MEQQISMTMGKLPMQTIMIMNLFALRIELILHQLDHIADQLRSRQRHIHRVTFSYIVTSSL